MLNTAAKTLLLGSIGDDPLDFAAHLDEAHKRYNEAYAALYTGAEWISQYLVEVDERSGDFEKANTDYISGMTDSWDSTFFKDEDGNAINYLGFFDFAAHMLYDHAEVAMDEIATTLRTVANGIHTHFHDVVSGYQTSQDETRLLYQKMVKSEDTSTTFETIANDNADDLDEISTSLHSAAKNYDSDTKNLPIKISDSATLSNESLKSWEENATQVADTNYNDLDELIPKFTVTGDIVDSLISEAADDLKDVRDKNKDDLEGLTPKLDKVESDAKVTLVSYLDEIEPVRTANYDTLNNIARELEEVTADANSTLANFF